MRIAGWFVRPGFATASPVAQQSASVPRRGSHCARGMSTASPPRCKPARAWRRRIELACAQAARALTRGANRYSGIGLVDHAL